MRLGSFSILRVRRKESGRSGLGFISHPKGRDIRLRWNKKSLNEERVFIVPASAL
jgi:hypothetical protein